MGAAPGLLAGNGMPMENEMRTGSPSEHIFICMHIQVWETRLSC